MTRAQIIRLLQEYPNLAHKILKMLPLSARKEANVLRQLYGLGTRATEDGNSAGAPRRAADLALGMGITVSRVYQLRRHGLILICQAKRKQAIIEYIMTHIVKNGLSKTNQNILNGFGKFPPDDKEAA